jgi:hypothetical protein
VRALIAAIACWGIGCAGATSNVPTSAFRASDASLFDHAVDRVRAPVTVDGELSAAFERRVVRSDFIAIVRVASISSDWVRRRSAYRLAMKVKERLKGSWPKELVLIVHDDQPGYESVKSNEDRLLRDSFVAFLKWENQAGDSERIAHWHLSPDSDAVREQIDYLLGRPASDPNAAGEADRR